MWETDNAYFKIYFLTYFGSSYVNFSSEDKLIDNLAYRATLFRFKQHIEHWINLNTRF